MKKTMSILSVVLSVVMLLGNLIVSAEVKTPTVMLSNNNAVLGETGRVAITVDNFDGFIGGYNFEIKFPEIIQIMNVYLDGKKLTSMSDGGADYNVRNDNTLVLAGICNYGSETDLSNNTVYHVEFITPIDAVMGEYPVEFTDETYIVSDFDDEELIFPVTVNGKINLSANNAYKADIDESGIVDATDMVALRKWLIGVDCGTVFNKFAADVNDDGEVDIRDLVAIKKYFLKAVSNHTKRLPDTGGIVEQVSGGADEEAEVLRTTIDEAKDNLVVTGKKYYVSQNGNDSNDGTSPQKAVKTLSRVEQLAVKSGDGVFLERGSVFREASSFILKSGVTYGAYGQGAKPEVWGSERNYADKNLWTLTGTKNVWKMSFTKSDAGIIVLNGGSNTGKKQMYLNELTVNDDFYHDWDNNILYFYCDRGNPGEVFSQIEIGVKERIFHLAKDVYDITIDNIGFKYSGIFGIRSEGNAQNITITNCAFSWIGGCLFNDKSNRYGNGIEFVTGCENILVKNCSFDQIFDSGVTFQIGNSPYRNFVVEDCLFEYNGMSGFEWWAEGDDGEQDGIPIDITVIEDIAFRNNIVRLTGYGWSKATRSPAHIRSGWRYKMYSNLKNFTISNNIFDCANGQIIASLCVDMPESYTVCDNTYYQRYIEMSDNNDMYLPFISGKGHNECVSNREEFIWSVIVNDESPRYIEWLEQ